MSLGKICEKFWSKGRLKTSSERDMQFEDLTTDVVEFFWSLTQFYPDDLLQSRISVKSVFTNTHSRSVVFKGVSWYLST